MKAFQITINKLETTFKYKSEVGLIKKMIDLQNKLPTTSHVSFMVVELEDNPKQCKCGKLVYAKGLCSPCYQKNRPYSPPIPENFDEIFNSVLEQVEYGNAVYKACDIVGVNRTFFYRCISELQKKELIFYKALYSKNKPQNN